MKSAIAVVLAVLTSVAVSTTPASASVHHSRARRFASCHARGDYAICVAAGTAHHPATIRVHVSASPRQRVSVAWDLVCSQGLSAGSRSGQFTARTTVNRVLRHPYRHPASCVVSADAQLSRGRRLHVWLTYRR